MKLRAESYEFTYRPAVELADKADLAELTCFHNRWWRRSRPANSCRGSLVYRRNEMLKIVHPVCEDLLKGFPFQIW